MHVWETTSFILHSHVFKMSSAEGYLNPKKHSSCASSSLNRCKIKLTVIILIVISNSKLGSTSDQRQPKQCEFCDSQRGKFWKLFSIFFFPTFVISPSLSLSWLIQFRDRAKWWRTCISSPTNSPITQLLSYSRRSSWRVQWFKEMYVVSFQCEQTSSIHLFA